MRLLFVINALGEGGTESSTAELLPRLRERGFDCAVAILRSRGAEGVEQQVRDAGFRVAVLPPGLGRQIRSLHGLIDEGGVEVVHSALFEANLVSRLGRRRHVPLLTSLVNLSYSAERMAVAGRASRKLRVTQAMDVTTGPLTSHFHAVSDAVASEAAKRLRIRRSRITVVPRGRADLAATVAPDAGERLRNELGIASDDEVVVSVARQEPQKDHLTLLDAVEPLLVDRPGLHLVVAGREGTASAAITDRMARMSNRERVHMLGHRSDVASVLDVGDVFVFPTRYEGMPGAIIEAMAMGLPVVASDIAPVREVLAIPGLPAPGDAASFSRAIRALLSDKEARRRAGLANRARFERHFTIERSADGMAELYRRLLL